MNVPAQEVVERFNARALEWCQRWLPGGKQVAAEYHTSGITGGAGSSLKVHVDGPYTGRWRDWSCMQQTEDMISMLQQVESLPTRIAAIDRARELLGVAPFQPERNNGNGKPHHPVVVKPQPAEPMALKPVTGLPVDPKTVDLKGRLPVGTWTYLNRDATQMGHVNRYNMGWNEAKQREDKEFRPVSIDGVKGNWYTGLGPLFGLELLKPEDKRNVLLVEGEKTCVLARHRFRDWIVLTWIGGASRTEVIDWQPLIDHCEATGAKIVLWPDIEECGEGINAMRKIKIRLSKFVAGIVDVPQTFGKKWDLADKLPEGVKVSDLHAMVQRVLDPPPPPAPSEAVLDELVEPDIAPSPDAPYIILPSDHTPILDAAKAIFGRIGKTQRMYNRSGAVMELVGDGLQIVTPEAFRSRLEDYGCPLLSYKVGRDGDLHLGKKVLSFDYAKTLLASTPARDLLPPISLVTGSPVLVEDSGRLIAVGAGYNPAGGGVFVTSKCDIVPMSTPDAVALLLLTIEDFLFVTPGDKSRAIASLITPAMKMAGLIPGFCPLEVSEAKESQSGKGFRDRIVRAIYNDDGRNVTKKSGGVGSTDESLAAAILSGRAFIEIDNVRGKLDSQFLESVLTSKGQVECRIPGQKSIYADCSRITFQLTSNGMESTPDLANRCSIVRINKKHDRIFRQYQEGSIEDHIKANRGRFIGAVFQIIREWHEAGAPCVRSINHDFREWAGILDPIVQNLFGCPPLLDGHDSAKARVSNTALSWLRHIAIAALASPMPPDHQWTAIELADLSESSENAIPGDHSASHEDQARTIGRLMARCFKSSSELLIENIRIEKSQTTEYDPVQRKDREKKTYRFTELFLP